jgi:enoyl-CoA hydratase/carnithine racemase
MSLVVEEHGKVLLIALNRPQARNALDPATDAELEEVFARFARSGEHWVAVLAGEGDHFCAGADLKAHRDSGHRRPEGGITRGYSTTKPIIAALQGAVFGGGLELALCADIRIADETARLGQLEVRWGLMPGAGGTQRLPRLIGHALAAELIFTGDPVDAVRAERIGLVNKVVPAGEARKAALEMAQRITERAPLAVRRAKEAMVRGAGMPLEDALRLETLTANLLAGTEDMGEGRQAFAEKRPPKFQGR